MLVHDQEQARLIRVWPAGCQIFAKWAEHDLSSTYAAVLQPHHDAVQALLGSTTRSQPEPYLPQDLRQALGLRQIW